jgi:hypothetical protein
MLFNYPALVLFYALIGTTQGVSNASMTRKRVSGHVQCEFFLLLCGLLALVYAFVGASAFRGGNVIGVGVSVLVAWWCGHLVGVRTFRFNALVAVGSAAVTLPSAVLLFHKVL